MVQEEFNQYVDNRSKLYLFDLYTIYLFENINKEMIYYNIFHHRHLHPYIGLSFNDFEEEILVFYQTSLRMIYSEASLIWIIRLSGHMFWEPIMIIYNIQSLYIKSVSLNQKFSYPESEFGNLIPVLHSVKFHEDIY